MPRPFKSKTLRDRVESQIADLATQTEELRKQVVERAPAVRDQIVEQTGDLRKQVVERAPVVRDQIVAALPDKEQLLDLRDDLFEKLPDNVQDRLPEKVKPKRRRLRKVAAVGVLAGAGGAAFAILKRKGTAPEPYVAPAPTPPAASTPPPAPSAPVTEPDVATAKDFTENS